MLLQWYAVHESPLARYDYAYYHSSKSAILNGRADVLSLTNDTSISPAAFMQIDSGASIKAYFDKASYSSEISNATALNITFSQ